MRNRFYKPSTGRFMAEDPIGLAGGDVNFNRYVMNDPVNWVDPEGLAAITSPYSPSPYKKLEGMVLRGDLKGAKDFAELMGMTGALAGLLAAQNQDDPIADAFDDADDTPADAVPDDTCEDDDPCKDKPCEPPKGEKFNITTHWTSHSGEPGKGSHGCEDQTGSPVHWHYSVMHQNPETCECFEEQHAFGGCGPGPGF